MRAKPCHNPRTLQPMLPTLCQPGARFTRSCYIANMGIRCIDANRKEGTRGGVHVHSVLSMHGPVPLPSVPPVLLSLYT